MLRSFAALALSIGLALPAIAQQPPPDEPQRQLGTHAHGQGKLSIAIERRSVAMELEAPGSDIVGFEHAATTPEHKQAIARARAALARPLALFKLPEAAGCKLNSAKVKLVGGGAQSHGHAHGHSQAKAAKGKEADTHAEFHAEYSFACARPELIQSIELDYFKTFPGAEALDVTLIGPKGHSKQKATRDRPRVELKGTS